MFRKNSVFLAVEGCGVPSGVFFSSSSQAREILLGCSGIGRLVVVLGDQGPNQGSGLHCIH
jgi:hypothetical protein